MNFNNVDKSLVKLVKWIVILLLARVRNPLKLAGFLSLNPLFRKGITNYLRSVSRDKSLESEKEFIDKASNALSCGLLYSATIGNTNVPSDYIALYLWGYYFGNISKRSERIRKNIKEAICGKVNVLDSIFSKLYKNKEFILYSVLFGKMLSQYLTPLSVSPDRKYLSSPVKRRIFDPIWKCYSLSATSFRINWFDLLKSYGRHNIIIGSALFAFLNHRTFASTDIFSKESQIKLKENLIREFKRVNSFINAIYLQNILSFLLLSGTAVTFSNLNSHKRLHNLSTKRSTLYKNIIGLIGFISAYSSLYLNESISRQNNDKETTRLISKAFLNGLNVYLLRLILISKWRMSKDYSPYLRNIKKVSLNRAETIFMCLGMLKLMNYNSYLKQNNKTHLQAELISMVDKFM